VLKASPVAAQVGDRVTLSGKGFDRNPRANEVTFADARALVVSGTAEELTVVVPAPTARGGTREQGVVVKANGASSSGTLRFKLEAASSNVLVPRYYAAVPPAEHTGHDHAVVACELGPVMLFSSRADAASTAERAVRVADALNALTSAATRQAVSLESRNNPPSVAVVGQAQPLVTVTPEDAAGYGEGWEGPRAAAPGVRELATFWAALLQDHLTLFVAHDRPTRTVQISPRGKVLLDIYADSARRGQPTGGIPIGIALSSSYVGPLRALALVPAGAGGAGPAAVVVAGGWSGTMDEPGVGSKRIDVDLQLQGARLTGTLTSSTGGITMKQPLTDVSFEKGQVRFTVQYSGRPCRFQGTIDGHTMSGTFTGAPGGTGQFSLSFGG
jgi:hypothetical protein